MTNKETFANFNNNGSFDWEAARTYYNGDEEKVINALHRFYDGYHDIVDEIFDDIIEDFIDSTPEDMHPYTTEYNREIDYAASMGYGRF